jgi:DNA-binding LacI/PurR family transcriptional regulator
VSLTSLDRPSVLTAIERLRAQGVHGILVVASWVTAASAFTNLPDEAPVVAVVAGPDDDVSVVAVDQFAGAAAATRHLLNLGHRTVRHLAGPAEFLEAQQRIAGWRAELEAAGAEVTPPLAGDWSARSGYEIARSVTATPDVSAVFVGNDQMALGLLRRMREDGRRVPEDISIVGFDDIPEAPYFSPPLTTVRQDFLEMGRRSLHLLLDEIASSARTKTRVTVPSELIVRLSTRPARSA